MEVNFFNYIDLDVVGPSGTGGGNDLARLDIFNPSAPIGGWIKVWDNVAPAPGAAPGNFDGFNYIASGANLVGWEIGAWTADRRGLTNTTITNLPNTASPFGPGDFVGLYQWRFILDPGQSADGWVTVAVNVPEPGSLIALGAGLASLLGLRRRRKR
ncbi:MAG: PEP-CTERM sorting domain-containing protein [Armatimonadota bacterium]|nr:PEP-CTERM sorting domain-containing protein [Armatimonadota bacterium]